MIKTSKLMTKKMKRVSSKRKSISRGTLFISITSLSSG